MPTTTKPLAIIANDVPGRKTTSYPQPFAAQVAGREKRALGDAFHLKSFGVNLTHLAPGAQSALLHRHTKQEEFVYILQGKPTLVTDKGEVVLNPGECVGFLPNDLAHHLVNRSTEEVVYLEVGNRVADDTASYPNDDLKAIMGADGHWQFRHKNGDPY